MSTNTPLGTRYFKYDDDGNLQVYRLTKNKPIIELKDMNSDDKISDISDEELKNDYTKLNPDAVIIFNIVTIRDLKDVIVTVYRKEEINGRDQVPYCICRQNITDFFANSLDPNMQSCGVSVTKETVPEGVSIQQLTACDNIDSYISIAYYMGESLKQILSYIKSKEIREYDNVLYSLFLDHIKYKSKTMGGKLYLDFAKSQQCVDGYCTTLCDLLYMNNFMYDLMRGFNIYPLNIDLTTNNNVLNADNRQIIEKLICKNIVPESTVVIEYDKDIDLDEIKTEYILVYDINEKLYVVAFETHGKYHIPVEDIESEENIAKLANSIGYDENSSITEAYNIIQFNRDKYK